VRVSGVVVVRSNVIGDKKCEVRTHSNGYVANASTPPATPPERSETIGGVSAEDFIVTKNPQNL